MSTGGIRTPFCSLRAQFEAFQAQSEHDVVLILFELGAEVSLRDALLMCPNSREDCPDGPPDAASVAYFRRYDDGKPTEFIFASPYSGDLRGRFYSLSREAGVGLGNIARGFGLSEAVLAEQNPTAFWIKLLFSFAIERPDFPARSDWRWLHLLQESCGRYAIMADAIRCSLYAIDCLESWDEPLAGPSDEEAQGDDGVIIPDPDDERCVRICGKRVYLGGDTQVRRILALLANPIGQVCSLGEVQMAVDGMRTDSSVGSSPEEIKKANVRVRKAWHKLKTRIREHDADAHVILNRTDIGGRPEFTLVRRHGQ